MCPACITGTALMVVGVVSTGGVSALIAKTFGVKKAGTGSAEKSPDSSNSEKRREGHGNK